MVERPLIELNPHCWDAVLAKDEVWPPPNQNAD